MRRHALACLCLLPACATVPGALPAPHYADAASRGAWSALMAGRPTRAQVDEATERWSEALATASPAMFPRETWWTPASSARWTSAL